MGQYHKLYNLDKKESINPSVIGNGLKLMEQIGWPGSTSTALFLLVANSNGRGGGDAPRHPMVGRWAGDRILVQGDYANSDDPGFVEEERLGKYLDISAEVSSMMQVCAHV